MLVTTACKRKGPPPDCISLNNKGAEYFGDSYGEETKLNNAIKMYKKAIACDSLYVIAHLNLMVAYGEKHNYKEESAVIDKLLKLTNNDPAILLHKGMYLKKTGKVDSATKIFYLAKSIYDKRLLKEPGNVEHIKRMIEVIALIHGNAKAIKELDRQIELHSALSQQLSEEYFLYKDFDGHNPLNDATTTEYPAKQQ
ncbi:hypothetical protein DJ568_15120 [Mucilaginibacter hurinus]|uniref:Uncharacterized protein n=1 Tax=Mucilaginibacter hurinus TaxID=2201324 RepID=A0A367GK78_9SPHI|nr:hypothetical protein [Mucilaginibacter hurinus]RCH53869.1 hypothetical protein DJ568_15120 [Mucilaginibacter hurinus]